MQFITKDITKFCKRIFFNEGDILESGKLGFPISPVSVSKALEPPLNGWWWFTVSHRANLVLCFASHGGNSFDSICKYKKLKSN